MLLTQTGATVVYILARIAVGVTVEGNEVVGVDTRCSVMAVSRLARAGVASTGMGARVAASQGAAAATSAAAASRAGPISGSLSGTPSYGAGKFGTPGFGSQTADTSIDRRTYPKAETRKGEAS